MIGTFKAALRDRRWGRHSFSVTGVMKVSGVCVGTAPQLKWLTRLHSHCTAVVRKMRH